MFMYDLPLGRRALLRELADLRDRPVADGPAVHGAGVEFATRSGRSQPARSHGEGHAAESDARPMWYDVSAFPLLPSSAYRFGDSGRNILDGPGLIDTNVSLIKRFRIQERYTVQFRCEAFNALNHPNFNLPNHNVNAPAAGTITDVRSPRLVPVRACGCSSEAGRG